MTMTASPMTEEWIEHKRYLNSRSQIVDLHCLSYIGMKAASVVVKSEGKQRQVRQLTVVCLDQYGWQREFDIQYKHKPGDSKNFRWEVSAYKHPFKPPVKQIVSAEVARKFIKEFIYLLEKHTGLLFNEEGMVGEGYAERYRCRHEGWVRVHEYLVNHAVLSVLMLRG